MDYVIWVCAVFAAVSVSSRYCQSSTLTVNVVKVPNEGNHTFTCSISSASSSTRWHYLNGPAGAIAITFTNEDCIASSEKFIGNRRFEYTCNSTVNQVTLFNIADGDRNNVLACRENARPNETESTWIIKGQDTCTCEPTMTFNVIVVTEGENVTFICRVSSGEQYVNWDLDIGSTTAAMGVGQNGHCTTSPSGSFLDNTSQYIYTCNNTVYQVTRLNVSRIGHNDMYKCTPFDQAEGTGSNWIVKVNAPVTNVTIISPVDYLVNVTENTQVEFACKTSTARPAASVYWYRHPMENDNDVSQITYNITTTNDYNDLSVTTSILRFVPTQEDNNTKIFCRANNSINTSPVRPNTKRLLNVLYKAEDPYIRQGNHYRVIENTSGTLVCSVKGGNPTPTLSWSCDKFPPTQQSINNSNENVTTTLTWTPLRTYEGKCTCTSTQAGFTNKATANVSLVVLYPPSKPTFRVNGGNVDGGISFIEGNSGTIKCTSNSKPSPDRYIWAGPKVTGTVNIQLLILSDINKTDAGEYMCSVHNTMDPSNGGPVTGINRSTVNVVVLYPPMVSPMNNISKQNGTRLNVVCNFTAGMPKTTLIKWTRDVDNRKWNNAALNIESLERRDTGIYTCTSSNIMKQSGDNKSYIGQHNQSFNLNVQYAASITSFTIGGSTSQTVTVNETDQVRFICNADGNPTAVVTLSHERKTLKNVTSNNVDYNITEARCLDAGTYFCTAQNMYIDENGVQNKKMLLFVNCSPRVGGEVDVNITSERDKTVTIVFNVIAYPTPTFSWYQLVDGDWTPLHESVIKSANLQSNLTIHSVGMDDFTSFKVVVVNELGQMEQIYTLSPYDIPDPPTKLRHIEGRTTTSSIHIEWEPGFDNGPSQTFHIKYKKSSETVWNYLNVSDNGEPTMNITLTGLLENTQYEVIIFASNVKGNSTESDVLITRTKAIPNSPAIPGALIGGIAGGVTGCIVIVIVIVFIIRRYPLFKENGANRQNVRRSVSDDSDDEDGLVDNPMYASSSNVAQVASTSASISTDIYSKPVKPHKTNAAGNGDIYSVVNKTKGQGKGGKCKSTNEKGKQKEGDVYENVELENIPNKKDAGKKLPPKSPAEQPKLKIVNQDGLIYADLVFKDKPPGEKMVILGDDPTPYDLVDFTKKADPLPESDEEEQK